MIDKSQIGRHSDNWPIRVKNLQVSETTEALPYSEWTLETDRGDIQARFYPASGVAEDAVIFVGGVGGGFDSPARDLYARLPIELQGEHIASLRVRYRHSTLLEEAIFDVLAGIEALQTHGIDRVSLVGHSFGGAVVITSGALAPQVTAIAALSSQSYGAALASELAPRPLLLIHGTEDEVLPMTCSEWIFRKASEPKRLELLEETGHMLEESADRVTELVREQLLSATRRFASHHAMPDRAARDHRDARSR